MALTYACERLVEVTDLTCTCDLPGGETGEAIIENVLDGASDLLSYLAEVPLGRCSTSYRPCRDSWCQFDVCSCCGLKGIHLPGVDPTVDEILIDGAVIDPADYTIIKNGIGQRVLVRIGDNGRPAAWPSCQKLLLASSEVDTFELTVTSGLAVDMLATLAAAEIACDVFTYLANGENLLPDGTVSAIAYGVNMDFRRFSDPTEQNTMNLAGLGWTQRFLNAMPTLTGVQVLSPEIDDGWTLYVRE